MPILKVKTYRKLFQFIPYFFQLGATGWLTGVGQEHVMRQMSTLLARATAQKAFRKSHQMRKLQSVNVRWFLEFAFEFCFNVPQDKFS